MKKTTMDTYADRYNKRSLPELLVHKFLTEYGYSNGPVIARAIVADILGTIERCYPERVPPKTVVWLAVRRTWRGYRKGIPLAELVPVRLVIANQDEVDLLAKPPTNRRRRARRAFNRARFVRWCFDAYHQGGVLTLLDLSMLSGMSEHYVSDLLREYEAETGKIVPTRGTVHDLGGSVTHKAEVIRRWLRQESPAQIARAIHHSQEAVDRYIADFKKVRLLAQKFPMTDIPVLAGLSEGVVKQYVALLREYEPTLELYSEAESNPGAADTEPESARAQTTARGAGRVKGARRASERSEASLDQAEHLANVKQALIPAEC